VGLDLLHGFVIVNFSGVRSIALRPTPNLEDQGLYFVWPYPGMGGTTRSLRSPGNWSKVPLHDNAVVLEWDRETHWDVFSISNDFIFSPDNLKLSYK
jgi:hypothetical protein